MGEQQTATDELGGRLRKLRRQHNWTLQEVADRCGFTRSLLSKIENGRTTPPIATLMKLANAYGVTLPTLLEGPARSSTVFTPAVPLDAEHLTPTDKGYGFYAFAANKRMQPFLFVAEKGRVNNKALSHAGEEFVYVLEGEMKYRVAQVEYHLRPGDSLYFDPLDEHDFEPITERVVYLGIFNEA